MTDEKAAATLRELLAVDIEVIEGIIAHRKKKRIPARIPCGRLVNLRAASDLLERLLAKEGL